VSLTQQALQRLGQLGYASEPELRFWRGLWESEGESFFWQFLRSEEKAAEEYRQWFPRLQEFAADCRRAVPVPALDTFSTAEREQYRVLRAKMQEFAASEDRRCVLGRKPHQAAILSTTRVGLSAAEEVFAEAGAVLLREEERERWFADVYPGVGDKFWWYAFAWWTLREVQPAEADEVVRSYAIPEGCLYWVVTSGVQWGSLAGGANHELWRWDGTSAAFLECYGVDTY
jgi:hypothetical protein